MLDPVSIFTIAGAIAALLSGFKDARDMFGKWLRKRIVRKNLEEQQLDATLEESPRLIRWEYDEALSRIGSRFTQGDDVARTSMITILVRMNERLIQVLQNAVTNTSLPCLNCKALRDAALSAHHDSSKTIQQLAQRLLTTAPIPSQPYLPRANTSLLPTATSISILDPSDYLPPSTYAPEPQLEWREKPKSSNYVHKEGNDYVGENTSVARHDNVSALETALRKITCQPTCVGDCLPEFYQPKVVEDFEQHLSELVPTSIGGSAFPVANSTKVLEKIQLRALKPISLTVSTMHYPQSPSSSSNRGKCSISHDSSTATNRSSRAPAKHQQSSNMSRHLSTEISSPPITLESLSCTVAKSLQPPSTNYPTYPTRVQKRLQADDWAEQASTETVSNSPEWLPRGRVELDSANEIEPYYGKSLNDGCLDSRSPAQGKKRNSDTRSRKKTSASQHSNVFCSTAKQLQTYPTQRDWQSNFHFRAGSSDVECASCSSKLNVSCLQIQLHGIKWKILARFIAKCHQPASIAGGGACFGCALCYSNEQTFRSRNQLWAHLETHSQDDFEKDPDVKQLHRATLSP